MILVSAPAVPFARVRSNPGRELINGLGPTRARMSVPNPEAAFRQVLCHVSKVPRRDSSTAQISIRKTVPHPWHSRAGGGAVHSIRSRHPSAIFPCTLLVRWSAPRALHFPKYLPVTMRECWTRHWISIFAALITACHRSASSCMYFEVFSIEPPENLGR